MRLVYTELVIQQEERQPLQHQMCARCLYIKHLAWVNVHVEGSGQTREQEAAHPGQGLRRKEKFLAGASLLWLRVPTRRQV